MTNDEAIRRGERAKQLLKDPLLVEALISIEAEIIAQWEACPVRDSEGRELLWKYYKTAKKFRGILEGAIQNGAVGVFREQESLMDKTVNIFKGSKK